ncbi:MAG: OB-fold nucleic acid binding domain-containing protein [Planctomycetota bacterium]|nr:OB-fold nucleic acid binding domain-containing protein [Planctomycetota bacterium]
MRPLIPARALVFKPPPGTLMHMAETRTFIDQLKNGQTVDQIFLVRDKDLRVARNGSKYITCTLCDKTGTLRGQMWQVPDSFYETIPVEGFLQVKGRAEDYKGMLQVIIDACRPAPAQAVRLDDFIAVAPRDVEAMWADVLEILRKVKNKHLRLLIKKFLEDKELVGAFKRAPAALAMHHPYVGGLLEHTLSLLNACVALLPLYPKLNADLVLTGGLLHDVGKSAELRIETAAQYTERGQLVGHITIASIWIAEKAARVAADGEPVPARLLDVLQHIVLSHHGQREFGTPATPAVPEAYFLHYLDNLDAKMFMTFRDIEADRDPNTPFTPYVRQLETSLYKWTNKVD